MGRLPEIISAPKEASRQVSAFAGLNLGEVISENEFADMKNMSTERFPAVCTRQRRGKVIKRIKKPNGMYYKDGLIYVDGTELYYKDQKVLDVADSPKSFCGLGAWLLIWPDKVIYNTLTGQHENVEATWTQSGQATFEALQEGSTLIRISCKGIGSLFSQYDSVTIEGCTDASFNTTHILQECSTDSIVVTGTLKETLTQQNGLKVKRTAPDMDYLCENENRAWGCSSRNHEIYASKLGDPRNWNAFEGISTDSYSVTIGSDGDFTGCASFMGYAMFFKEDAIHKIYGTKPSNFQVMTSGINGVAAGCSRTIATVNETLYYVSRNGVCAFDGAMPELVSDKVERLQTKGGVAGLYHNRYYASLKDSDGTWGMYVYDARKGLWSKEDDLQLKYCAYGAGDLWCIDEAGDLFMIAGDREETIEWMLETGDLMDGAMEFKHLRRVLLHLRMEAGAELNVEVMYDNDGIWRRSGTYRAQHYRTRTINLVPRRCVHYRIRLWGIGDVTLTGMGRVSGYGTEIRGDYK